MEIWLWATIGIMAIIITALLVKIYLLQKSAREIADAFAQRLITETNTLIDISSGDKYMRHLANAINIQLRKLRRERHRFQQGDIELKNAVVNISHDLRTPLTAICGYLDLLEQEEKSETVKSGRKSTGLGLAIARTLVEKMGGIISAEYENQRLSIHILFPNPDILK